MSYFFNTHTRILTSLTSFTSDVGGAFSLFLTAAAAAAAVISDGDFTRRDAMRSTRRAYTTRRESISVAIGTLII